MTSIIRKLFIIKRYKEAFYQMTPAAQGAFWKNVTDADLAVGGKSLIGCKSFWSNEAAAGWGVVDYPNIQAVQQVYETFEKLTLARYLNSVSFLGDSGQTFAETVDMPAGVYQLYLIRSASNVTWSGLPAEKRDDLFQRAVDSIAKRGGKVMFNANISWSTVKYERFGVTAWPNVEAIQAHFADLGEMNWLRYLYAKTILGTKLW
jgi:hypothetical protein